MNLILLNEAEGNYRKVDGDIELSGLKAQHILQVLRAEVGDLLRVGLVNEGIAKAEVVRLQEGLVRLRWTEEIRPQAIFKRPRLVMGLPRPKVFRRLLRHAVILGYKDIHFCHAYRVEKSYWGSPMIETGSVNSEVTMGLEQAQDVHWPQVSFHRLFKPFMEDQLKTWIKPSERAIGAHPYAASLEDKCEQEVGVLIMGPEGGWIEYELNLMESLGVKLQSFSNRILSSETALPYITGRLGF